MAVHASPGWQLLPAMEDDMDLNEIDLEFMEQEAEERLTEREAQLLGLPPDPDGSEASD